jgi:hypothetical protein
MQKHLSFLLSFENANFVINGKYFKIIMTIQTIMFPLWFFKHTKMLFKIVSTHLGGSYDFVFTLIVNIIK